MKITLVYLAEEKEKAAADLALLLRRHPGAKVREGDRHPPFTHIYLTTRKPENPCSSKKRA